MPEKRKHKRASLVYYLKIFDIDTNQCIGHLVDISLGGLKMISESQVAPGKDHNFSIYLPENHAHKSFAVKVKSCWSKPDINQDYIASGYSFAGLSPESTKLIKMLIRRYELGSNTSNNSY